MGIRQTLKRIASVRSKPRTDRDAQVPINSPYQTLGDGMDDDESDGRFSSDFLEVPSDRHAQKDLPSARSRSQQPPTGKRKPSGGNGEGRQHSRLRQRHSNIGSHERRARSEEPRPQEYLYFGEGSSPPPRASPHQVPAASSSSSGNPSTVSSSSQLSTTGRDSSGFLNTGVSNGQQQSMGYQALTYGGSLQYDYAGVQAAGTHGF